MSKTETGTALWRCACGAVTVERERWKPGVPEHVGCSEMTYLRDL